MLQIASKVKAFIFDMDGTIIQSKQSWSLIMEMVLEKNGVPRSLILETKADLDRALAGQGSLACASHIKNMYSLNVEPIKIVGDIDNCAKDVATENIAFIDGFLDFHKLIQLHNIPSGIATNATRFFLEHVQLKLDLPKLFGEHLYCINDVNDKAKPHPDVFLHAAKKLNVKPEECIVFEDSHPGFMAAKAAGMKCVAIKNDTNSQWFDMVHGSISSYHEAVDVLNKLLFS